MEYTSDLPIFDPRPIHDTTPPPPQRSTRANLGQRTEPLFQNEVFNASLQSTSFSHQHQTLTYYAAIHTDYNICLFNGTATRAYAVGHKLHDPDQPSLQKAIHGD